MEYVKRDVLDIALSRIKKEKVLVLTGARQTGKTTFCEKILPDNLNLPFTYSDQDWIWSTCKALPLIPHN